MYNKLGSFCRFVNFSIPLLYCWYSGSVALVANGK